MKRFVKVIVTTVITLTLAVFALTACNDGGEGGGTAPVGDNVFREGMTYAELMQVIDEMDNFTIEVTTNAYYDRNMLERSIYRISDNLIFETYDSYFDGSSSVEYIFFGEETSENYEGTLDITYTVTESNYLTTAGGNRIPIDENGDVIYYGEKKPTESDDRTASYSELLNVFDEYLAESESGASTANPKAVSAGDTFSLTFNGDSMQIYYVSADKSFELTVVLSNLNATVCDIPAHIYEKRTICEWDLDAIFGTDIFL